MEKNIIPDELWLPLEETKKDAEKIYRPSMNFWQDGWMRLKRNKVAIFSMIIILIILLMAIFVPMFWPYSYEQQNLFFANIPYRVSAYPISEDKLVYITPQFTAIELTNDGQLIKQLDPLRKDIMLKQNFYEVEGKPLVVNFSHYTKALKEYNSASKKAEKKGEDELQIKKVPYLKEYFKDSPEIETVSILEAKNILDNKIQRVTITYDEKPLEGKVRVRNKSHIFGTDNLGRDLFIRIVYGARVSLWVGFFAAFINFVVGIIYGGISGYIGGTVDNIMMRIVDTIYAIPMTLYVILIMVIIGPGLRSIIVALGLTYWVGMARLVRGQVLSLKQQEFVKAAILIGADEKRILINHLVPNMMGPIMVSLSMQIPSAIFTEAFLSFIGLGISAPQASWGTLANDALAGIYIYPYQMFFPAMAISITILSFNLLSDGLRDAFDPRLRK